MIKNNNPIKLSTAFEKLVDVDTLDESRLEYMTIILKAIAERVGCDMNRSHFINIKSKPHSKTSRKNRSKIVRPS